MSPTAFFQQLVNGLTLGGMYALVALGYTMVYGIIQLINFAHGEVFMIGAFLGLSILHVSARLGINEGVALGLAFLGSMTITGIAGMGIERVAYRPLRNQSRITLLLSAVGMSIFLQNLVMLAYSRDMQPFPRGIQGGFNLHGGIKFDMGFIIGIKAFSAAVLGGIGNLRGAMLGGFILGLSETLLVAILSAAGVPKAFDYKDVIAFAILIAVLIFKPSGLLGERVSEKV